MPELEEECQSGNTQNISVAAFRNPQTQFPNTRTQLSNFKPQTLDPTPSTQHPAPHTPSEEETSFKVLRTLTVKPRPEYGLDPLVCAEFAPQCLGGHHQFGDPELRVVLTAGYTLTPGSPKP